MDVNEGGDGGMVEPAEHFHRNEAISAVADEGFLAEEEDDYEDLYNDVNVGENFLQSLRKNEEPPAPAENKAELTQKPAPPPPPPPPQAVAGTGGGGGGERTFERIAEEGVGSMVPGRHGIEGYQNSAGYRGPSGPGGPGGLGTPGGRGFRVELGQPSGKVGDLEEQTVSNSVPNQAMVPLRHAGGLGNVGHVGNDAVMRQGVGNVNGASGHIGGGSVTGGGGAVGGGGNGTILFVGDLHWWTTDAELEEELSKYGPVREVKFFDEKASGKSKGYCQVEFYDPTHATACKEGMNGHVFNGRPCVVAFASPFTVKKMGEAQVNRNQQMANVNQGRRGPGDVGVGRTGGSNIATGGNYQGAPDNNNNNNNNNRGYGRGNWGRGGGRGPVGPMRNNRGGGISGRGIMGNGGSGFGQGIGATPPMMHPNSMMGQGFDPAFGGPMGRMGSYGGFPGAPTPPFSGMLSSFPPVGNVGLPGIAPHINPAFFGRGMPMNGMGMMPNAGMDGPNMGMWSDPNMGGWTGEEHGGRVGESSYGEEAVSDHQYGESHDRGPWPGGMKEKDRGSERARSGSSDRRHRDDREAGYDRDVHQEKDVGHDHDLSERRHRDDRDIGRDRERDRGRSRDSRSRERDRDRHRDDRDRYSEHHRYRERETDYDNEWDRGRSSRTHSKSRMSHEEERSRSRDADYGKRRRLTSD